MSIDSNEGREDNDRGQCQMCPALISARAELADVRNELARRACLEKSIISTITTTHADWDAKIN